MLVHDLISRLGGPTVLGAKINAAPKAVSMWSKRDAIPRRYHLPVWRLAISQGIEWTPPGGEDLMQTLAQSAPKLSSRRPRKAAPASSSVKAA